MKRTVLFPVRFVNQAAAPMFDVAANMGALMLGARREDPFGLTKKAARQTAWAAEPMAKSLSQLGELAGEARQYIMDKTGLKPLAAPASTPPAPSPPARPGSTLPTGHAETQAAIANANSGPGKVPVPDQPKSNLDRLRTLPEGQYQRIDQPGQAPLYSNFADPGEATNLASGNVSGAIWEGDPHMTQAQRTAQRVAEIEHSTQLQRELHQARIEAMDGPNRLATPVTPSEMARRLLGSTDVRSQRTGAELAAQLGQQDLARHAAASRPESPLAMAQARGQQLQNQVLSRRDQMERQLAGLTDTNDPDGSQRKKLIAQMTLMGYRQPAQRDARNAADGLGQTDEVGELPQSQGMKHDPPRAGVPGPVAPAPQPPAAEAVVAPADRQADRSDFVRGVRDYLPQTRSMLGGAVAYLGDAAARAGLDDVGGAVRNWGLKQFEAGRQAVEQRGHGSDTLTGALAGTDGDLMDWVQYNLGQMVGNVGESVAAGLAGAVLGSAVPGPGTLGGGAAGLVGKSLIKGLIKDEAARIAERQLARSLGADVARAATFTAKAVGSTYGEAHRENPDQPVDLQRVGAAGLASGLLASAADKLGLDKLIAGLGARHANRLLGKAKGAGAAGTAEAGITAGQTLLERFGAGKDLTSQEALRAYVDAAGGGYIQGAAAKPAGEVFQGNAAQSGKNESSLPPKSSAVPPGPQEGMPNPGNADARGVAVSAGEPALVETGPVQTGRPEAAPPPAPTQANPPDNVPPSAEQVAPGLLAGAYRNDQGAIRIKGEVGQLRALLAERGIKGGVYDRRHGELVFPPGSKVANDPEALTRIRGGA
ncbi:hypothetical protein [Chitiniphilus eburneus]|uniref:Uncharacterized protein n=1 Tax=Chitiniphilus eburneus TaxID=2571148 RepID=A0A4U0PH36_9NEIS|nr:hypothetical protein [Chitiniphilus eburneus]TJZ67129.1 hypothetical protein FAZ21_16490 [Chitiniphilus eburneus]